MGVESVKMILIKYIRELRAAWLCYEYQLNHTYDGKSHFHDTAHTINNERIRG